ncbi:MAG: hypothetical protein ABW007_05915 [Chitinophagaceae bacterium]
MIRWLLVLLMLPVFGEAQQSFPGAARLKAVDKKLRFRGKLHEAWQWKDKLGENVLVTSELAPYKGKEMDLTGTTTIELFAVHYVKVDTGYRVVWRLNDLQKDCELDIKVGFIKNAITITDLDQDGIAETKLQYEIACRGDVSPSYMKLIMHEDAVKYSLRGERWVWAGGEEDSVFKVTEKNVNLDKFPAKKDDYTWVMGRYETEKDFATAPQQFLLFARKEWLKYAKETFE